LPRGGRSNKKKGSAEAGWWLWNYERNAISPIDEYKDLKLIALSITRRWAFPFFDEAEKPIQQNVSISRYVGFEKISL
jgi:hypothetical protein